MKPEFEIKVLDINTNQITKKLAKLGFRKLGSLNFQRYVYDTTTGKAWIRLRTDGHKTTLTYKTFSEDTIDGVQEFEIGVANFEQTHVMLELMGFKAKHYQENRRKLFMKKDVEISIDEWPLIPPYLEIEGRNEAIVSQHLDLLQLSSYKTTSLPTSEVYKLYGLDIDAHEKLTFSSEVNRS